MKFQVKKNTATKGVSLHTEYDYAMCPFRKDAGFVACGSWCALFHYSKSRGAVTQGCSTNQTIFVEETIDEKTAKSTK